MKATKLLSTSGDRIWLDQTQFNAEQFLNNIHGLSVEGDGAYQSGSQGFYKNGLQTIEHQDSDDRTICLVLNGSTKALTKVQRFVNRNHLTVISDEYKTSFRTKWKLGEWRGKTVNISDTSDGSILDADDTGTFHDTEVFSLHEKEQ